MATVPDDLAVTISVRPVMAPIDTKRPSLAQQVYDSLIEAVLDRRIAPGDRLIMDQLAETLGVSRTPVRDALLRLESEGLIEATGRRGYEVRAVGDREVLELYQAREAIEGHAVVLLCAQPDRLERVSLVESAVATAALDGNTYTANRAIHRSFLEQCGNGLLLSAFDSLWGASLASFAYGQMYPTTEADLVEDHRNLIEAVAAGDEEHARTVMVDHIRAGLDRHLS